MIEDDALKKNNTERAKRKMNNNAIWIIDDLQRFNDASRMNDAWSRSLAILVLQSTQQITLPMPGKEGCAGLCQQARPADATCDRLEHDGQWEAIQPHMEGDTTANLARAWRAWFSVLSATPKQQNQARFIGQMMQVRLPCQRQPVPIVI